MHVITFLPDFLPYTVPEKSLRSHQYVYRRLGGSLRPWKGEGSLGSGPPDTLAWPCGRLPYTVNDGFLPTLTLNYKQGWAQATGSQDGRSEMRWLLSMSQTGYFPSLLFSPSPHFFIYFPRDFTCFSIFVICIQFKMQQGLNVIIIMLSIVEINSMDSL